MYRKELAGLVVTATVTSKEAEKRKRVTENVSSDFVCSYQCEKILKITNHITCKASSMSSLVKYQSLLKQHR